MHLYTFPTAPNPLRLVYFMKYKGITDLEITEIDLRSGEHFQKEFKAINPLSTLPTLVLDDGTVLTDTISICVYLDHKYPEKSLFGSSPSQYAEVIGWDHRIYVDGLGAVAEILRNQSEFFKDRALPGRVNVPQLDVLIERGKLRLDAFWLDMNDHLSEHDYIVSNQLTLADIDVFVICSFAGWVKEVVPTDCTHLIKWQKKIAEELGL